MYPCSPSIVIVPNAPTLDTVPVILAFDAYRFPDSVTLNAFDVLVAPPVPAQNTFSVPTPVPFILSVGTDPLETYGPLIPDV
jgi:hypothetical protein